MRYKLLIDECLHTSLVAVAKDRGFFAHYVPHFGKAGWQDYNLAPFAMEHDYVLVTNNRKDLLREYAQFDVHPGLIIIIPSVRPEVQRVLFEKALTVLSAENEEIVNKILEVTAEGGVFVREWSSDDHDPEHITNPKWPR